MLSLSSYKSNETFSFQPVNIKSGFVITGFRHANIMPIATQLGRKTIGLDHIQGFLTSHNRFVNREEARKIAVECNQVTETYNRYELFSEDIY